MDRIDAHQHFWKYDTVRYDWIDERMSSIRRDFLPDHLEPLLTENGFSGCVAVQADQSLEENEFLLALADQHPFICGVVGWVDLCKPDVESDLDRLQGRLKFKGVRHVLQSESDDAFMLKPAFKRGISLLAGYDLTYDILIFPKHLPYASELVSQFPDQPFVIDHLAKPAIRDQEIEQWMKDMNAVARFPNVMCKLSGMVTEADWNNWTPAGFEPYLDVALNVFGAERLMFGSDWPVSLVAGEYAEVVSIVESYLRKLSAAEQAAIFGNNAKSFYKLI